jgi:N-formylglutamate amidohydrolase
MDSAAPFDFLDPPFVVHEPETVSAPVVFASPHSGRLYPPHFVSAARLDATTLRRSEDAFIDELFAHAPRLGMPLIEAMFPRAYLDANREPWELDPAMFADDLPDYVNCSSPRASAGLGTIARIVAAGSEIYRDKLTFTEARQRIERLYMPYHAQLADLLAAARARWQRSILIDCHSMPSIGGPQDRDHGRRRVDFVLGDCHGESCARAIVDVVERDLVRHGYAVARNDPYAGGFTTRHYGRPRDGQHVLQIEINRALYLDEARIEKRPYFSTLARHLAELCSMLRDKAAPLAA